MNDELAVVPIAWLKAAAALFAALVFGAFLLGYTVAPAPKPMPAPVAARLVEHRVRTVVDTARVRQLEADVARLGRLNASQIAVTKMTEDFAKHERQRGDTLQALAIAALTDVERAKRWKEAHDARKRETDSLWSVTAQQAVTIARKDTQLVKKDSAFNVQRARAERADARLAEIEPLATGDDGCRIVRYLHCPTRTQALLGGAVLSATAIYVVPRLLEALVRPGAEK